MHIFHVKHMFFVFCSLKSVAGILIRLRRFETKTSLKNKTLQLQKPRLPQWPPRRQRRRRRRQHRRPHQTWPGRPALAIAAAVALCRRRRWRRRRRRPRRSGGGRCGQHPTFVSTLQMRIHVRMQHSANTCLGAKGSYAHVFMHNQKKLGNWAVGDHRQGLTQRMLIVTHNAFATSRCSIRCFCFNAQKAHECPGLF